MVEERNPGSLRMRLGLPQVLPAAGLFEPLRPVALSNSRWSKWDSVGVDSEKVEANYRLGVLEIKPVSDRTGQTPEGRGQVGVTFTPGLSVVPGGPSHQEERP